MKPRSLTRLEALTWLLGNLQGRLVQARADGDECEEDRLARRILHVERLIAVAQAA